MTKTVYTFEQWMRKVDAWVDRVMGLSAYDLPDWPYREAYDKGCSYKTAASRAMKGAGI